MANPKWPSNPPPPKKELAIRGDLLLLKRPKNFLEQRVHGGGRGGWRWAARWHAFCRGSTE